MSKIIYLLKRSIDYAISLGQNPNAQKYRWERYGIIETAFYLDLIDKKMYEKLCKEYFY